MKYEKQMIFKRIFEKYNKSNRFFLNEAVDLNLGACVIVTDGDKWLAEDPTGIWKYEFPQGHVNEGENIKDGMVREMYEETGYKIDPSKLEFIGKTVCDFAFNHHYPMNFFLYYMPELPPIEIYHCDSTFIDRDDGIEKPEVAGFYYEDLDLENMKAKMEGGYFPFIEDNWEKIQDLVMKHLTND